MKPYKHVKRLSRRWQQTGVKMQQYPVELNSVIYNATTQSFEALVTVHAAQGARKYACAFEAPITMSYADAASGLATQALRRHAGRGGLSSSLNLADAQSRARAGTSKTRRKPNKDPIAMLRNLAA
ncbi:orotidine 5-phosphate decarboxylase [Pseudosulfitobacter sp. DSM 107133]|uniref:orotidine 5-phosphate decarboxylase n=2 Tax=Pseudosulfitobacter sp. DSM 107133 TaxID=2883100 RepID=UPI001FAE4680|nr:orotidine 5-phosphate decarboxylase [Pseudosulfitobacter sp. DSM 107133]